MITAKKTAKNTDAEVIRVRRLFLHKFLHAIFTSSFMTGFVLIFISFVIIPASSQPFHILLREKVFPNIDIEGNLQYFDNGFITRILSRDKFYPGRD